MTELRREYTLLKHLRQTVPGLYKWCFAFLLGSMFIGGVLSLVHVFELDATNNYADAQTRIAHFVNQPGANAADRKALAKGALSLDDDTAKVFYNDVNDDQRKVINAALKKVATSGAPLEFHIVRAPDDWAAWRADKLNFLKMFGWLYISMSWFLAYVDTCTNDRPQDYWRPRRPRRYLMDLPWRQGWPVVFVLFTAIPIGWPFYLVSAVRVHRARRVAANNPTPEAQNNMPEQHELLGYFPHDMFEYRDTFNDYGFYDNGHERDREPEEFKSDLEAARTEYLHMRESAWEQHVRTRSYELRRTVTYHKERLRELGDAIRKVQTQRSEAEAELRSLETIEVDEEAMPDKVHLNGEFDRLLSLPGVAGARVLNDGIALLVKTRIKYHGVRYDLGDWELTFGAGGYMRTREIRSGVRRTWGERYPVYRIGRGQFCFGNREADIGNHARKGQFLEAIEIAINSMQSVNKADRPNIPRAFKEAKDDE